MPRQTRLSLTELSIVFTMFATMVVACWSLMCYMKDELKEDVAVLSVQIDRLDNKVEDINFSLEDLREKSCENKVYVSK